MSYSANFGQSPQVTMERVIIKPIYDQFTKDNKFLKLVWGKEEKFSGNTYNIPFIYKETQGGKSFRGLDIFENTYVETEAEMSFGISAFRKGITLPGIDLSMSVAGGSQVSYFRNRVEQEAQKASKDFTYMLFGDGTGNDGKDFLGLVAGVDNGSVVSSYGGRDRTAGAGTPGHVLKGNTDDTAYNSGNKFSLAALGTLQDSCENGEVTPDLIMCGKTVYNIVQALMPTVTLQTVPVMSGSELRGPDSMSVPDVYAGHKRMYYNGTAIIKEQMLDYAHSTKLFVLNTDTWSFPTFNFIGPEGINFMQQGVTTSTMTGGYSDSGAETAQWGAFTMTNFQKPNNQYSFIADLYVGGQFICKMPNRNGYFTNITA